MRETIGGALPYVQYCCTCYREKQNSLEAARINRTEGNRATSVSERSSLWPQSVPGWQLSCERLPPASWAAVGLSVGNMALCRAVACCVEYCCSGPSVDSAAAVFASRKQCSNISATDTTLSILPILGVSIIHVMRFWRGYSGQPAPHSIVPTCGPLLLLLYNYTRMYKHIFILSRTVPWNHDGILWSTRQCVPLLLDVLLQQMLHSRISCLCPEIMSSNNIPRQARPVEQTATILSSRKALKSTNIPFLELFVLRELWRTL